jgi:hypothetical protein
LFLFLFFSLVNKSFNPCKHVVILGLAGMSVSYSQL